VAGQVPSAVRPAAGCLWRAAAPLRQPCHAPHHDHHAPHRTAPCTTLHSPPRRSWASPTTRTGPRRTRCASAPGPRAPCTTRCWSLRGGA
jgi:hypothetical protein